MRSKVLFYVIRRWSLAVRRSPILNSRRLSLNSAIRSRDTHKSQRRPANDQRRFYPGLSRCTTFVRYPAFRKSLLTSSAIMTERCWPPVQPKEIVR